VINASLGEDGRVEESAILTDRVTGEQREVDVLLTMNAASYTFNIAIEVVGRRRKADTTWVECMKAKHADLPTDKLVLVAEQGFTVAALKKASFYEIETITIDSALETDWKLASALTAKGFFELTTFEYSCSAIYQTSNGRREQLKLPNDRVITVNQVQITLDDFVRYVLALPAVKDSLYPRITSSSERDFWFSYSDPSGSWATDASGGSVSVIEIRVGLHVEHSQTPIQFSTGKYRGVPFVEGSSSPSNELQFVLLKRKDGSCEGLLADISGVRKLVAHSDTTGASNES